MKTIITLLLTLFTLTVNAQSYTRQGTVFTQTTKQTTAKKTQFIWTDSKGNTYPIYITETGRCYILKMSQKTGKEYKSYLKEDVCREVCKSLGVVYVEKKK